MFELIKSISHFNQKLFAKLCTQLKQGRRLCIAVQCDCIWRVLFIKGCLLFGPQEAAQPIYRMAKFCSKVSRCGKLKDFNWSSRALFLSGQFRNFIRWHLKISWIERCALVFLPIFRFGRSGQLKCALLAMILWIQGTPNCLHISHESLTSN